MVVRTQPHFYDFFCLDETGRWRDPSVPAAFFRAAPAFVAFARFHADTTEVLSLPSFRKRLEEQGGAVVNMSSSEFGKLMVSEQNKWLEVIRSAGIKGE